MEALNQLIKVCADFIWNGPILVMLLGTHLLLTVRLRFIQRYTGKAIRMSLRPDEGAQGEISQFGALATALAATIGTGNIIGVSTAIALGGPGAVLWCWLTGVFGIATKYGEALLAVKYRTRNKQGAVVGGPMYTIERGLGWKWLAVIFAVFTVFATLGAGSTVQSHAISDVVHTTFGVPVWASGLVITLLTAVVILGGVKVISRVCEKLVPFMSLFYILGCLAIGLFYGLFERNNLMSANLRLFLTVGLCGGFTTFSTFINESFQMIRDANFFYLFLYVGLSLLGGLFMLYVGYSLVKWL